MTKNATLSCELTPNSFNWFAILSVLNLYILDGALILSSCILYNIPYFLVYNTHKNYPKTPKEPYRQKIVKNNKNIINYMDQRNTAKTSNSNKNIIYSKNSFGNLFKMKKNKTMKK